jgi:hypothetical protein
MPGHVRVGGSWKTVSSPSVRVGGSWKPVTAGFTRVGGAWKQWYTAVEPSSYDLLETVTIGSAGQTVVEFINLNTNYASTYQHLQLRTTVRTNRTGADSDPVRMRLNSDNGSNYTRHRLMTYLGNNVVPGAAITQDAMFITESAACANNAANIFAGVITDILDPFETGKNTTIRSFGGNYASGWNAVEIYSGLWNNTNAITTITLTPLVGSHFVQYTGFSLYGLKGN